ncbi:MAG: glycosyltransferase [Butyrivibrio sp.]|nr:glycosyltransferase [Butyrivibrio sp.]
MNGDVVKASAFEEAGNLSDELEAIADGLQTDPENYELFYMLGAYHLQMSNINKAYLCFERALFYMVKKYYETPNAEIEEDIKMTNKHLKELQIVPTMKVRRVSIVIVSYNDIDYMKQCLGAIRGSELEDNYQIVVVDNASTDGVLKYLQEQDDIVLIENPKNLGYPEGCNIGVRNCNPENDVLLLNNDAILTPNALFWLRMGLYDNRDVGATGAMSSNATLQTIDVYTTKENGTTVNLSAKVIADSVAIKTCQLDRQEKIALAFKPEGADISYEAFVNRVQVLRPDLYHEYEDRQRLTGFALLIKRQALMDIMMEGDLLDTRFSPGYFEDDDLGIRLAMAGYRQFLCHNSYVYHYGGKGFEDKADAMEASRKKFENKWGFDIWAYSCPDDDAVVELFARTAKKVSKKRARSKVEGVDPKADISARITAFPLRILEIGCGFGATLGTIKYIFPNAYVAGIESSPAIASIGRAACGGGGIELLVGDPMMMQLSWSEDFFDYIIVSDTFLQEHAQIVHDKFDHILKKDGGYIYI